MAIAKVSCTIEAHDVQNVSEAPKVASVALVPVIATPRRPGPVAQGLARPDPSFVTHLIAMAELSPQTQLLQRAAAEDVQAAYRSVATQNRTVTPPGARMRHVA
jgi:hypothetical protein